MTLRRLVAASACLAGGALVAVSAPAAGRPAAAVADRCLGSGPIPVTALRTAALTGCPLVGRTVTAGRSSRCRPLLRGVPLLPSPTGAWARARSR
jgi:hypothetical protein